MPAQQTRLRPMTVRFDPIAYEVVANEAQRMAIPVAQFVREAALIRAMMRALTMKEDLPLDRSYVRAMAKLSEEVVRLADVNGESEG